MQDDEPNAGEARERTPNRRLPVDPDVEARRSDRATGGESLLRQARRILASRWDVLAVIAVGGALGSLGRWALGQALVAPLGGFPWATFVENVSGGFAIGVLTVFVLDVWPSSRYVRPFLGVGVLGGFTTWSTFMLDTRALVVEDRTPLAVVYLFGTLIGGLVAVWAGLLLARFISGACGRRHRRNGDPGVRDERLKDSRGHHPANEGLETRKS